MTDIMITAKELRGKITPPPFKSEVIRYLLLSALCGVKPADALLPLTYYCDDVVSAINGIQTAFDRHDEIVPVGDSAALLRILTPVLLTHRDIVVFSVGESLFKRELFSSADESVFRYRKINTDNERLIEISGRIKPGRYELDASKSSQTASGFLIACAVLPGLMVRIDSPVSKPYLELTKRMLAFFNVFLSISNEGFYYAKCSDIKLPSDYSFQPDYSYAANFIAADFVLNGKNVHSIEIEGNSAEGQADYAIHDMLSLNDFSIENCPDLFPVLCVIALKKQSDTVIRGASRLKQKESNRLDSVKAMIESIGGTVDVFDDHVIVHGAGGKLYGGTVDSFGDHRIVMAAAIASLMCSEPVIILNAEAVNKSAPGFFSDFQKLGGIIHEYIRN